MVDDYKDWEVIWGAGRPVSNLLKAVGEQVAAGPEIEVDRAEDLRDMKGELAENELRLLVTCFPLKMADSITLTPGSSRSGLMKEFSPASFRPAE